MLTHVVLRQLNNHNIITRKDDSMQHNKRNVYSLTLSLETIKTVRKALIIDKNRLEGLLIKVECGRASKEYEEYFKNELEKVKYALESFEEVLKK